MADLLLNFYLFIYLLFIIYYFGLLKSPTVHRNSTELTGINNEEIVYTLLNIFKYPYSTKESNKKKD